MNGYTVYFLYFLMYISPFLDLFLFLCHKISSMMRKSFFFLLFFLSLPLYSQKSKTAQSMEAQGLVDIASLDSTIRVSLMYSRADNFTGKVLYSDLREAYLHPKAAKALVQAQKLLKDKRPDLSLIVYDAARPMTIQQKMWNVVAGTSKNIYVSNPRNGGGLHNYGMAVDITLCDVVTGDTLDMGTKVDFLGSYAHIDQEASLVKQGIISIQAKKNRELLRNVMRQAGFTPLRSEWWHFNLISRAEARAKYKVIK